MKQSLMTLGIAVTAAMLFTSCATGLGFGRSSSYYQAPRDHVPSYEPSRSDVQMGMKMLDVLDHWGEPKSIQSAGDPNRGNQRWIYPESAAAHLTRQASRIIYFEDGQVAGWETVPTWGQYR